MRVTSLEDKLNNSAAGEKPYCLHLQLATGPQTAEGPELVCSAEKCFSLHSDSWVHLCSSKSNPIDNTGFLPRVLNQLWCNVKEGKSQSDTPRCLDLESDFDQISESPSPAHCQHRVEEACNILVIDFHPFYYLQHQNGIFTTGHRLQQPISLPSHRSEPMA